MDLKLIIYDFDGVMTDNRVLVFEDGKEAVFCNRSDGLAVEMIRKAGIKQFILTSENNLVTSIRAFKLKIPLNISNNKKKTVEEICNSVNTSISNSVVFVGNDLNDLEAIKAVGFSFCPADACYEVKKVVDVVTISKGGEGVIREIYGILMEKKWLNKK